MWLIIVCFRFLRRLPDHLLGRLGTVSVGGILHRLDPRSLSGIFALAQKTVVDCLGQRTVVFEYSPGVYMYMLAA